MCIRDRDKAAVRAEVVKNFKDDKILVFKKKRRKQYRRTYGHRQPLTEVRIQKIYADKTAGPPEEPKIEIVKKKPSEAAPPARLIKEEKVTAKKILKKKPKPKAAPAEKPKAKKAAKAKPAERPKAKAKKKSK